MKASHAKNPRSNDLIGHASLLPNSSISFKLHLDNIKSIENLRLTEVNHLD